MKEQEKKDFGNYVLRNQSQVHGASAVVLCKPADADNEGTCENLGYPKNQRPF